MNVIPQTWYQALVLIGGSGLVAVGPIPIEGIEKGNLVFIFLGLVFTGCGAWIDHPAKHYYNKLEGGGSVSGIKSDYSPSIRGSLFSSVGLLMLIPAVYKIASQTY
ncbi:hypothetical protein SH580_14030 [Coraliomargarita algicola]|uniref:Uncharacterized protein n=1 Tax=Coraliomargarita algicola TaxID=3092156 RepID=A0ABZ0RNM1_9BACT|nr:hypothetical protein [Coraliomargarita sp. J2-16]WPJ94549.1 hypothetical protein SH580_14030 [Coraliomargarita sp. J2-16]